MSRAPNLQAPEIQHTLRILDESRIENSVRIELAFRLDYRRPFFTVVSFPRCVVKH